MIGAVLGALLAYAVVTAQPDNMLRRATLSVCGVLAQFGGVTLAFAFLSPLGFSGLLTEALRDWPGIDIFDSGWLFGLPGLVVVYCYFQIPLMVIVFLPALEGLRPQWREAAETLGGSTWHYWRHGRLPAPAPGVPRARCCCCSPTRSRPTPRRPRWSRQGNPILRCHPRGADQRGPPRPGEPRLRHGAEMIVVVAVVMGGYALLLRRTARWMR